MDNYEKKYKDALEWARKVMQGKVGFVLDDVLEKFPELRESEDEKTKRMLDIITYKMSQHQPDIFTGEENEWFDAWLEKQGQNFTKKDIDDAYLKGICDAKHEIEKQGEQKPIEPQQDMLSQEKYAKAVDECIYGEQKPAEVEPKFHVKDWVVTDKGDTTQIAAVNTRYYTLNNGMKFSTSYIDKYWHKWTIQDAKDGDVLVDMCGNIGIYNSKYNAFDWTSYCSLGRYFQRFKAEHENEKTHPATKEQRDLLFQKMKESGYEWDAENKQLKKMKQKIENKVDTFKDKLLELFQKFRWKGTPTNGDIMEYVDAHIQELVNTIQKPAAWSGEDERIYNRICDIVHNAAFTNYDVDEDGKECGEYAKIIGWFKAFKDRVQPKQEWSKEDETKLNDAIDACKAQYGNMSYTADWLKSLKDRYTWKPSDEQMEALLYEVNAWDEDSVNGQILKSLYQDLKKLKQ